MSLTRFFHGVIAVEETHNAVHTAHNAAEAFLDSFKRLMYETELQNGCDEETAKTNVQKYKDEAESFALRVHDMATGTSRAAVMIAIAALFISELEGLHEGVFEALKADDNNVKFDDN